ncbi:hypothetical protein COHA_006804 [Chlorella ohadii]|uniref:Uncharacterized protein n=1 Tax=Chlorella ohadii TaxID=2649997 RepID=A0AAD5H3F1_9CHLO|nr:hypothetical protein COHA_006804 [Chlorella ohadii]
MGGSSASVHAARRPFQQLHKRHRGSVTARAGPGGNWSDRNQRRVDNQILIGTGLGLTALVLLALRLGSTEAFQSAAAFDWTAGDVSFGLGDALGGMLWAASLYFCSPLQLLLLFFGFIETERPSDWVLRRLGLATGQPVDAIDYRAPPALMAATVAVFVASGLGLAWTLQAALGDATWSVSTGLGSLFAAGMKEVGRPRRLTVEQAQEKERQWQDFARFADARLQRSGRCHETEIIKALQRELPQFRREGALEGAALRQLVRNWAPDAERTSAGYFKGLSLLPAGGAPVPPPRAQPAGSSSAAGSSAAGSVDNSVDQY